MSYLSRLSTLRLYYEPRSGPCRTVMLVAKYLGLEVDLKLVSLMKGEHMSESFLKLNPQHAVPVLTDGDFALAESRAIITYLAEKYSKDETFYPKDPQKRSLIQQRLYFDMGDLYGNIVRCYAVAYFGAKTSDDAYMPKIEEALKYLNLFLEGTEYVAGSFLTVADLGLVSSVATAIYVLDFDIKKYRNVDRWLTVLRKTLPDYEEIIDKNGKALGDLIKGILAKNSQGDIQNFSHIFKGNDNLFAKN